LVTTIVNDVLNVKSVNDVLNVVNYSLEKGSQLTQ